MADVYSIAPADLYAIERNLKDLYNNMNTLNRNINSVREDVVAVDNNVKIVYSEVEDLARKFKAFVDMQMRANAKAQSQGKLIELNQEIEKKFGHYATIRRTTTGILQADDLGIVKKETITNVTEEMMLTTPGYWLSPCLVALAAWINDKRDLAERALKEAIKRNDEKTSLFFALICRRADRKQVALKWTQRYLANQDEENLDRKTVIILDAFASGLLGADSEGVISKQMTEWLDHLADKPGFLEQQKNQWANAIKLKKKPYSGTGYTYLSKYSKTWPALKDVMEGAYLHSEILNYFTNIFEQEASTATLKEQLDEILDSLVTDFDNEEIPLRKEHKYHQLVVDFDGDTDRASQHMKLEESAFETHKDFTQLLTDAAMNPETSHASVSTQKFSIALSKEWITDAYADVTASNRAKIPNQIEINVDTFNDRTSDGKNEKELLERFRQLVESEKNNELSQFVLSAFDTFCLYGGIAIGGIGLISLLSGNAFFGLIAIIAGAGLTIKHFSKKKKIGESRDDVEYRYNDKLEKGSQIIKATLAEVVDFRAEFAKKDAESQKVTDFLEQISPEQYVRKLSDSGRRINVSR